ncbi:MAG: chromate transporter [Lawsonibacter sp.]
MGLYFTFAKIGVCTFGGGYAMLPILQREVVEKKHWATEEDLTDYYAIGQCTPGVIAVNTATFIGYRYKGLAGGMLATLGVISPSILIISVIAVCLSNFADIPVVQHALPGVNACVVALIASSVIKLGKSTINDALTVCIFLVVLALAFFVGLSPAILIVCAGVLGYAWRRIRGFEQKGRGARANDPAAPVF